MFDVIPAVLMYRSKVRDSEWPDEEMALLIDQVMVPMLRPASDWRRPASQDRRRVAASCSVPAVRPDGLTARAC
ncbi:hypothetical protein [Streptomyces niveus]|uniref:hypothetical protein n=1 Tax=Streptomyces niveus TaxID=193462 RepID=UPI003676E67D